MDLKKIKLPKRFEMLIENVTLSEDYYDLFCDHGKLGLKISETFQTSRVHFNDLKDHLLDNLKKKYGHSKYQYIYGPAENIIFEENSIIFLCGVGGHTLIRCLNTWEAKMSRRLFSSLTFISMPYYYQDEFRNFLNTCGFSFLRDDVVKESNRFYEIIYFSGGKEGAKVPLLNSAITDSSHQNFYYLKQKQMKLLRMNSLEDWEEKLLANINSLLLQE